MGLLTITGAILDTRSLWPTGESDADTLVVDASRSTFHFRPHAQAAARQIGLFQNAEVTGMYGPAPCISNGKIKVRLQGVDAPELHLRPTLPSKAKAPEITDAQRDAFKNFNLNFRQAFGEEASLALRTRLQQCMENSDPSIQVRVESRIDLPNEPFDVYGRFIGDVVVTQGGANLSVSRWLLENGWAFPSYYESMEPDEIARLNQAWDIGCLLENRPWKAGLQYAIPVFNERMTYKKGGPGDVQDKPLTYPKIFRRQAEWWARTKAGIGPFGLVDYIGKHEGQVFRTREFLVRGRASQKCEFEQFIAPDLTVLFDAESIVFRESDSTLMDANGGKITSWSGERQPTWSALLSNTEWVNSVAISGNGSRIVGATFRHDYATPSMVNGQFGIFGYDSTGARLWSDVYQGWDGVFAVAVSGDGAIAAAGGWLDKTHGLLRAYDAATGALLLDHAGIPKRVSSVSLSDDGTILAAAADKVYVFARNGGGFAALNPAGTALDLDGSVKAVAVHPSGAWLVACDMSGQVLLVTLRNGAVHQTFLWKAPDKPVNRSTPGSPLTPLPFLSVAIASQDERFAVGGGDFVYLFTKSGMMANAAPIELDTWDGDAVSGKSAENVRWVALSGNGDLLSVVANRKIGNDGTGVLLVYRGGVAPPVWRLRLPRNPNGTSIDAAGGIIAVADGFPVGKPAAFLLFDANGQELWQCPTKNMNWPIAISADGRAVAAGGDDGVLYYFVP